MDTSDLSALAGNTLVAAAGTDAWATARQGFASLFGGGQPHPVAESRRVATAHDLQAAPAVDLKRVQAALAAQWATRIADVLEEFPEAERPQAEAELRSFVNQIRAQVPAGSTSAPPTRKSRFSILRHVSPILALASGTLFLAGFVFIGFYVASNPGPHLRYLGVGWLAACAAFVTGCLAGLVVGIPRFVSSGALRHDVEAGRLPPKPASPRPASTVGSADVTAADRADQDQATRFAPSSNLAEISDWLTKLLLGAGLVELTRLGGPLGALFDAVARGLGSVPPSGPATVVAAAILVTYVILGFLDGYVVTTLWYGKHLQELGYQ
jgi:hypothetical protein